MTLFDIPFPAFSNLILWQKTRRVSQSKAFGMHEDGKASPEIARAALMQRDGEREKGHNETHISLEFFEGLFMFLLK